MGADLDLQVAGDLCRVQDVSGDSFVVSANGSERLIPVKKGLIDLKIQQSLKLTDLSATIANLKGERAYTPENDPNKKFARAQSGTSGQDLVGQADGFSLNTSGSLAMIAQIKDPKQIAAGVPAAAVAGMARLRQNADNAGIVSQYGETNNVGNYVAQMERELALQLFDAMDVTFEVSSEKTARPPLRGDYRPVSRERREPGKSPDMDLRQAIPPVDNTPQKVHLVQGGFPPGFIMDGFKVHLFDRGRELATNVAENRVELTYNDAFKYACSTTRAPTKERAFRPRRSWANSPPAGTHV